MCSVRQGSLRVQAAEAVSRTLEEAAEAADRRFRALANAPEGEPFAFAGPSDEFRRVLLGLPLEASEAIAWLMENTRAAIMRAGEGEGDPDEILFGFLLTTFLTGALLEGAQ